MHISVEVCFVDPCDPDGAVTALREHGYGPFSTQTDALAFAEDADGAIFECQARLTSARES